MADVFSAQERSWIMGRVHSRDTSPERAVRSLAHRLGYRFRLHRRDLPGAPDIVFPARGVVTFVHGCFWHGHGCARGKRVPKTNTGYWRLKISKNKMRDTLNRRRLRKLGWEILILWECQLSNLDRVAKSLVKALGPPSNPHAGY